MFSSISGQKGSFDPIIQPKGAVLSFVKSMVSQIPKVQLLITLPLIEESSMYFAMKKNRRDFHRSQTQTGQLLKTDDLSNIITFMQTPLEPFEWISLILMEVSMLGEDTKYTKEIMLIALFRALMFKIFNSRTSSFENRKK